MLDQLIEQYAQQNLRLVRMRGEYVGSACPFHKGGMESKPSFWIKKGDSSWGCFTCGMKGHNIKELAVQMGVTVHGIDQALKEVEHDVEKNKPVDEVRRKKKARASFEGESILPENLLGVFDWCPLSLVDSGFDKNLLREHDIGFDEPREKITFPIRDLYGNLIGISGRSTNGSEPKYKVYSGRRYDSSGRLYDMGELGEMFPSYSSNNIRNHLWRMNRVFHDLYIDDGKDPGQRYLVIVEGYKACLWVVQNGWYNTVAIMGSKMSAQQERIVRALGVPTWILLDNNEAGREGTDSICQRLGDSTFPVYRCEYPEGCKTEAQPDDMTAEELERMFASAKRVGASHARSFLQHAQKYESCSPGGPQKPQWQV
jgi:DNA primase